MRAAFYVDSHGFGHATRSMALAEALPATWEIVFKTNAPEWLFQKELPRSYTRVPSSLDIHPVHSTSYRIDPERTLRKALEKIQNIDFLVRNEVTWLKEARIDLVISDITPVAIQTARAAGIPGFGVSNFTWDWIFEPLFDGVDDQGVVKTLRQMMAMATTNFRLPFSSPDTFPYGSLDSPLLVRSTRKTRDEARRHYGFAEKIPYVLITFGGIEGPVKDMSRLRDFQPLHFLYSAKGPECAPPNRQGLFRHPEITNLWILRRDDLYHPDLVNAVDCVVTKPGYGILSECMATATPILLDTRDDFREFEAVRATAARYPQMAILDNTQMEHLEISGPLSRVLEAQPKSWEGGIDGASYIAETIAEHFQ